MSGAKEIEKAKSAIITVGEGRGFVVNGRGYFADGPRDRLIITAAGGGNNWANMLAACHKRKEWDYEREWRIVYPNGKNNFSIPIKSITAGLRADRRVQERLFEIAQKLQVPFYKTLKSRTEAKLFFEQVTQLA